MTPITTPAISQLLKSEDVFSEESDCHDDHDFDEERRLRVLVFASARNPFRKMNKNRIFKPSPVIL